MKNWKVALCIVFLLGAFLRFYQLESIPPGLHQDEASLGYNAYSILKTGKDMTGNFLPVHLESFYYSPAGYSYLAIPSIVLFDLNVFSTRFPSALFGSLTIITTFFLSKQLLRKYKYVDVVSLFSAFSFAVSPWSINLSRTATENVPVVFFISLGVLLYLYWYESERKIYVILSFVLFFLSLFVYQAPRSFLPFLIPILFIFFYKKSVKTNIFLILAYSVLIILPILFVLNSHEVSYRIRTLSIFNFPETKLLLEEAIREDGIVGIPPLITRVYHNGALGYSYQFLDNYFKHFSYEFFFTDRGLPDRYKIPFMGLLYIYEFPFILIGVFALLKQKLKEGVLLLGWILLAPVGSALTFDDVPNLQRTLMMYPALSILFGVGLYEAIVSIKKYRFFRLVVFSSGVFMLFNFSYYMHQYYVQQLVHPLKIRGEGYKELANSLNYVSPKYNKIVVTGAERVPAIYLLFYSKYDPSVFQKEVTKKTIEGIGENNFNKYIFFHQDCVPPIEGRSALYVELGTCTKRDDINVIKEVKRTDKSVIFRVFSYIN